MINGVEVLTSEMVRTSPESDALIFVGPFLQVSSQFYFIILPTALKINLVGELLFVLQVLFYLVWLLVKCLKMFSFQLMKKDIWYN